MNIGKFKAICVLAVLVFLSYFTPISFFFLLGLLVSIGGCYCISRQGQAEKFKLFGRDFSKAQQYLLILVISLPLLFLSYPGSIIFWLSHVISVGWFKRRDSTFSVATYNILSDVGISNLLETWDGAPLTRHQLLMQQFRSLDADILGLQQVGVDYWPLFNSELEKLHYIGSFHSNVDGKTGLAMFYKKRMLTCDETLFYHLHDELLDLSKASGVKPEVVDYINKHRKAPTVLLIKVLSLSGTNQVIISATIHVSWWNLRSPDLQAFQAVLSCRKIYEIRQRISSERPGVRVHVVFSGDFNGERNFYSLRLVRNDTLSEKDWTDFIHIAYDVKDKIISRQTEEPSFLLTHLGKYLHNPLPLKSAYFSFLGKEPNVTNADSNFTGTLDYIFHSKDLSVSHVHQIGTDLEKEFMKGGPSEKFGSDHLPLKATFDF